jgi:hypothetical protein
VITEDDVEYVPSADRQVTRPGNGERRTAHLRLSGSASERVRAHTGAHVGEKLVIRFNDGPEQEVRIVAPLSVGLACDITSLCETLEEFEADYLTSSR